MHLKHRSRKDRFQRSHPGQSQPPSVSEALMAAKASRFRSALAAFRSAISSIREVKTSAIRSSSRQSPSEMFSS